jgi:hypothetical protein
MTTVLVKALSHMLLVSHLNRMHLLQSHTTNISTDTGIRLTHNEFEGRAVWGFNAVSGTTDTDNEGHGT